MYMKTILLSLSSFILIGLCNALQGQVILPYTQDFESSTFPPQDWEFFGSNTNASWEHNTTTGGYDSSSACMYFDNFSSDLSGNYYGIRAPSLDLSTATQPALKFDVAYARKSAANSDRLGIWYSFNGSTGWTNLINYQNGTLTTAPDQATLFVPAATEWQTITLDLSQFAGTAFIRFAFENNCDFGNAMYIDNVRFYDASVPPTGVAQNTGITAGLNIFPNPSEGREVQVHTGNLLPSSFVLYNSHGKEVSQLHARQQGQGHYLLQLEQLPAGLYFLSVYGEDQTFTEKILLR